MKKTATFFPLGQTEGDYRRACPLFWCYCSGEGRDSAQRSLTAPSVKIVQSGSRTHPTSRPRYRFWAQGSCASARKCDTGNERRRAGAQLELLGGDESAR